MFNAILFQSAVNSSSGAPQQQLSNLCLNGISTNDSTANTDSGKLYGTFAYSSGTYSFCLFSDEARTAEVASGSSTSDGLMTITQNNQSGISGTINIIPGTVINDNNIEAIVFFSDDNDIPMNYLQSISDYNQIVGFADFSRQAFEYIKQIIVTRFESVLWNDKLVDVRSINGGTGGFDLSIITNWQSADLREASANYVLYLIARKQNVNADGAFAKRAECAKNRCTALLQSAEMAFDMRFQRIPTKTRTLNTFKIGRA